MVDDLMLGVHIAAGSAGLLLGPVAMLARKRPGLHTRTGEAYHWLMLAVCASAVALAVLDWDRLWWFVPIAAGSYAFALAGYLAAKRRWRGWLGVHVGGQGGSFIALTTALLVVNTGSAALALLPTVVGSPLIAWVRREVRAGRRPRYRREASAGEPAARSARRLT